MAALSTTPVQIPAGTVIQNTGSNRIYFDRQSQPTTTRHIGHINPGDSYSATDAIWIVALFGDTTYSTGPQRAAAAWSAQGAWSASTDYAKGDVATWQGSSFVALNAVPQGGSNPKTDTTNWLMIAQGGGEIAYAENVTNQISGGLPVGALFDVPGLAINVPANSGAYRVRARMANVVVATNAGTVAGEEVTIWMAIIDEGGLAVAAEAWRLIIPVATAAKNHWKAMTAERRLPNNGAQKTYKLSFWLTGNNGGHQTVQLWGGPGNETLANSIANFDWTPAYITAEGR